MVLSKNIQEVFTGILVIDGNLLKSSLSKITNQNAATDYYLTDLGKLLSEKGVRINCIQADPDEAVSYTPLTLPTTPYV